MSQSDENPTGNERLSAVLDRLVEMQTSPEWAAQRLADEQGAADERERWNRERRAGVLVREHVPLTSEMERALIRGDDLRATQSLRAVRRWMGRVDVPPVLVLAGGPGCGKSLAAAWALAQRGGRWRSAAQIVRLFAAQYGPQLDEQEGVLRTIVFVLDDLGGELDAGRMESALLEILDARQRSPRRYRTVVTTNLSRDAFALRYASERIASRMKAVSWFDDPGPDLRGSHD